MMTWLLHTYYENPQADFDQQQSYFGLIFMTYRTILITQENCTNKPKPLGQNHTISRVYGGQGYFEKYSKEYYYEFSKENELTCALIAPENHLREKGINSFQLKSVFLKLRIA